MASLGKCLVFYLQHAKEMGRLYGVSEPNIDGLDDPARVLEMAQQVGQRASQQAADLLEECAVAIEPHLATICRFERTRGRRMIEKNWSMPYGIHSLGQTRREGFELGLFIRDEPAAIITWIWSQGGKRGVESLLQILGTRADKESRSIDPRSAILTPIPIPLTGGLDVIPTEPLVREVSQLFAGFTRCDIDSILNIA
jgi:hypothetical protein